MPKLIEVGKAVKVWVDGDTIDTPPATKGEVMPEGIMTFCLE